MKIDKTAQLKEHLLSCERTYRNLVRNTKNYGRSVQDVMGIKHAVEKSVSEMRQARRKLGMKTEGTDWLQDVAYGDLSK